MNAFRMLIFIVYSSNESNVTDTAVKVEDYRMTTNLENLEYSGISTNMENLGNSRGILCF